MTAITTEYGETYTIRTIAAGYSTIEATDHMPPIDIKRSGGLWYAAYVGSSRWHNFNNGFTVPGGYRTRAEAAQALIEGKTLS